MNNSRRLGALSAAFVLNALPVVRGESDSKPDDSRFIPDSMRVDKNRLSDETPWNLRLDSFPATTSTRYVVSEAERIALAKEKLPSPSVISALVLETILKLNDAIRADDFAEFYQRISYSWKRQVTEAQIRGALRQFVEKKSDLSGVKDVAPLFDKTPTVDEHGLLVIEGKYPTEPHSVVFSLRYIYEFEIWRLFGISVKLK